MSMRKITKHAAPLGALVAAAVLVAGCGSNPKSSASTASTSSAASGAASSAAAGPASQAAGSAAPQETKVDALYNALPAKVKTAGKLVSVDSGSFPPYTIIGKDGKSETGASADMAQALGQLLGVSIEHSTVDGLASELAGIGAGRYDFAIGPVGDFKSRQATADFVDWVKEYVVFAVLKGNPKNITSLASTCGLKISVQAGGSAEKVVKGQSATCTAQGKPAIEVQSYKDQPSALLAVSSKRADAFFSSQAPLTYFTQHSNGELQLAGVGQANGFKDLYQGAVVPKGSPLGDVLLKAFQKLVADGTYKAIMTKWGLTGNEIPQPGLDLGVS